MKLGFGDLARTGLVDGDDDGLRLAPQPLGDHHSSGVRPLL